MIKSFFYSFLIFAVCILPLGFLTQSVWKVYIDKEGPLVKIIGDQSKIGIGSTGGKFEISVSDVAPGIDEVIVRLRQLRSDYELFRKKLNGSTEAILTVELDTLNKNFGEGEGQLEIVAFDRSFYNNRGSVVAKAFVDTKPPELEILSTQHNLRQGGTQLVLYYARDENLSYSGVVVGEYFFKGYPVIQIDSSLNKRGVYAAFYTVPIDDKSAHKNIKPSDIKVRAVDIGGNIVEKGFYNKIAKRSFRNIESNNVKLLAWLESNQEKVISDSDDNKEETKLEAPLDSKQQGAIDASSLLIGFAKVSGTALLMYADKFKGSLNSKLNNGDFFVFTGLSSARVLGSGEVKSVKTLTNSAYIVEVDHGLGISSFYKGVKSVVVREGQQLKAGDIIGAIDAYLAVGAKVSGVAVDLTELWSQDWIQAHILEKLEEAKRTLGLLAD